MKRKRSNCSGNTPSNIAVPHLLSLDLAGENETLVMGYIEGEPVTEIVHEHADAAANLAEQVIGVMLQWHNQRGEAFEDQQGGRHETFVSAFTADVAVLAAWLEDADGFDESVRGGIHASADDIEVLLAPLQGEAPVFIHDDAHAGNFLARVDGNLVGVIDPGRSRFTHRELDVFHLADAAPELDLMGRYLARRPVAKGWSRRRLLFSLWDDVKHARDAGWRDNTWLQRKLDVYAIS